MIMIDVDPEVPGSVCKKQVIGYEQKPVYEVVCLEA